MQYMNKLGGTSVCARTPSPTPLPINTSDISTFEDTLLFSIRIITWLRNGREDLGIFVETWVLVQALGYVWTQAQCELGISFYTMSLCNQDHNSILDSQ
jgi:hypothetical protein